jgi:Chaperone of endosialidase
VSKPEPPQPPDPRLTAGLSTATNVSTALANARLNAVNQTTPTGALTYNFDTTNQYSFVDPATGSTYYIPTITAQQTLTPTQQEIQRRSETAQTNLAGLAADQSGRISSLLGSPIDLSQAPPTASIDPLRNLPQAQTSFADTGTQQGTFAGAGDITRSFGPSDFSTDRGQVEQALFGRLNPQLDRSRQQLEQQLADQGIRYGSPAYTAAMDNWNRQANDLRLSVTAAGGAEQQRLFEMARGRAAFENAAEQQAYEQALGRGSFANTAQQNRYAQALGRGNFFNAGALMQAQQAQAILNAENARRANYLQEQYAQRQEPINEITALLSGSQVSRPSFVTTPQTTIPTTDIAGLINQNFAQQFGNYQQQAQSTDRLLGGILGLGSNLGAAAIRYSDRRVKKDIDRMGTVLAVNNNDERKRLPIYQYSYKGDPASTRHVGPMAQDVEQIDPRAVGEDRRGTKYIDQRRVMGSILRAA